MQQVMRQVLTLIFLAVTTTALPSTLAPRQTVNHVVRVEADTFQPESLFAVAGDTIQFQFGNTADTATQSTFTSPCTKLAGGFDSGVINGGTFTVSVQGPEPIFVMSTNRCNRGQVFVVNPTSDKSLAEFKNLAIQQG